jgi:predicted transcriptional regulator
MVAPPDIDRDKLNEAALAILGLTAHTDRGITRAWKGMDWDLLDELFTRGWIDDPKGKSKSVVLTDEGARLSEELLRKHFGK